MGGWIEILIFIYQRFMIKSYLIWVGWNRALDGTTQKRVCPTLCGWVDWNQFMLRLLGGNYCPTLYGWMDWNIMSAWENLGASVLSCVSGWIEIIFATSPLSASIGSTLYGWVDWNTHWIIIVVFPACSTLHEWVDWNRNQGRWDTLCVVPLYMSRWIEIIFRITVFFVFIVSFYMGGWIEITVA